MEVAATPIYVALVDLTGGPDFLELVRTALQAALEAVPPSSLFALVTFADAVTLGIPAHPHSHIFVFHGWMDGGMGGWMDGHSLWMMDGREGRVIGDWILGWGNGWMDDRKDG